MVTYLDLVYKWKTLFRDYHGFGLSQKVCSANKWF
uniref:Uncharacterized protein n=1 Tax=Rhizophora mucronata TaxID=61149 RepID=A0A2P2PWL6_RHIMU